MGVISFPSRMNRAFEEKADKKGRILVSDALQVVSEFFHWNDEVNQDRRAWKKLQLAKVTDRSVLNGRGCAVCPNPILVGDSVAFRRNTIDDAAAYDHFLTIHVRCLRRLVERAEPDDDLEAFNRERERIRLTGELWPSKSN